MLPITCCLVVALELGLGSALHLVFGFLYEHVFGCHCHTAYDNTRPGPISGECPGWKVLSGNGRRERV